jgi:hypothetical protein
MSRVYAYAAAAHDVLTAAARIAESMDYGREYIQRLVIYEGPDVR